MDGNGRWALQRNLARSQGHTTGLKVAKRIVACASQLGLRYLTLYVFSTENWKRAKEEVNYLMFLIKKYLKREYDFYRQNKIRVVHSGNLEGLPLSIVRTISEVTRATQDFTGLTVNLALNYGGRDEIIRAFKRFQNASPSHQEISEKGFKRFLDQPQLPDPDLIIRTGGEIRLSNFLLWQSAYAELYFSPKLWPDWSETDLVLAIADFQQRQRRFGGIK